MPLRICFLTFVFAALSSISARAEVRPHALVADGMVLQQSLPVRLWGTAAAGEKVAVEFRDASASTTAGSDGRWQVELPAQSVGGPFPLVIRGTNELRFKEVYVGEVWVCSGQSNMGWPVATRPGSKELQGTGNPMIRLFTVPQRLSDEPETDLSPAKAGEGTWRECGPESLVGFSAVAYYFGRELAETRKVPVGLIHASYGGSSVEQWIEREALAAAKGTLAVPPPVRAGGRVTKPTTSKLYNGMLAPLTSYVIRGVVWYQGEADVGRAESYEALFAAMIRDWRRAWQQERMPFLYVQIAPYGKIADKPGAESNSALLREAQGNVSRTLENAGMAVVTDWGHETDIHVKQKKPVGHRLALLACGLAYGEKELEYSGPSYKSIAFDRSQAVIRFEHVGKGLVAKKMVLEDFSTDPRTGNGGALHVEGAEGSSAAVPLQGFTIAGSDGRFVAAKAEIRGETVVVSSEDVAEPAAVRYGWADYPTGNLFNRAGLPAGPFRTDRPR